MNLSREEIDRYSRQLLLPNWSSELQESLRNTTILVDARLDTLAIYAAAVGIGRIVLAGENTELLRDLSNDLKRINSSCEVIFPESIAMSKKAEEAYCLFTIKNTSNPLPIHLSAQHFRSKLQAFLVNNPDKSSHLEFYREQRLISQKTLPPLKMLQVTDLAGPIFLMSLLELIRKDS
jgi:hypothetical protein